MQLVQIDDGDADLTIHNISILPADQCATEEQRVSVFIVVNNKNKVNVFVLFVGCQMLLWNW